MRTPHSSTVCRKAATAALTLTFLAASTLPALAQGTPFFPYYGKNRVKYNHFEWYIYATDHFEVFYYPGLEKHLERVTSYAESAYQHISYERQLALKHAQVEQTLRRVGRLADVPMRPIIRAAQQYAFRNRVRVHVMDGQVDWPLRHHTLQQRLQEA